jgi:hypothetical protein
VFEFFTSHIININIVISFIKQCQLRNQTTTTNPHSSTVFLDENLSPDSIVIVSDGIVKEMFKISFLVEQMPALRTMYESASLADKKKFLINAAHIEFDKACVAAAADAATAAIAARDARTNVIDRVAKFTRIFNLIDSAPNCAKSTSTSQQIDDDEDDGDLTNDQFRAALFSSKVVQSRHSDGGREFSDFVGKWTLPTMANAVWHAAADAIFENFDWPNREFRPMIPLSARVTDLQAFRNKPASVRVDAGFPREFEVDVTHPAVFAVLDETIHPLATLLTNEYLHLFEDAAGGLPNEVSYRNAVAIIFRDAEQTVSTFDECARRHTVIAVEAKRFLDAKGCSDALVGGERDFVLLAGDVPSYMMRVGTSLFTDGVDWYFGRIAWRMTDRGKWEREIKISPKIDVTVVGGWRLLSRWFAFAFHEVVQTPYESTGLRQLTQHWRVGSTLWQLCDVMSAGDRSMVSRWRTANNEQSVVIKFVAVGGSKKRMAELENYFRRECKMLRKFADEDPFVHVSSLFGELSDIYIPLEDGGAALSCFNVRGAAGKQLAKTVVKHIWRGALVTLKAASLCHFDITEHNIVVSSNRSSAKLIDLESVTKEGESAAARPTAATHKRPGVATFEFDEQCLCAVAKCLWDTTISSFEQRRDFVDEFESESVRLGLISNVESNSPT